MVATLIEAFGNYNNFDNGNLTEQFMIESYCKFINANVQYYKNIDKPECVNNNTKPVLITPWLINNNYAIIYIPPWDPPWKPPPIKSVLPVVKVNKDKGNYNTEICGSLKAFTFKAYKLLFQTINKYKDPSSLMLQIII